MVASPSVVPSPVTINLNRKATAMKHISETVPVVIDNAKTDVHQRVTDTILKYLENSITPWVNPWKSSDTSFRMPQNLVSGKTYNGINTLLLWGATHEQEFSSHVWGSFKQWQSKGEQISKGQKGTMVLYYDFIEKEDESGELKKVPFVKSYVVFNKCQLASYQPEEAVAEPQEPLAQRMEQVESFVANTKAVIKHKGSKACYIPAEDKILMPKPSLFIDTVHSSTTENYYSTLGHELVHWVGHEKRLNREFGKRFGDKAYAAEELVGEFGASFLCAELNISREPRKDHADYIGHWMQALKINKYLVAASANAASRAVEYLKSLQPSA